MFVKAKNSQIQRLFSINFLYKFENYLDCQPKMACRILYQMNDLNSFLNNKKESTNLDSS